MRGIAEILGEVYREKAYRMALRSLLLIDYKITKRTIDKFAETKHQGIGKAIMKKIREFIDTGKIAELDEAKKDPKIKSYRELSKIMGVGPVTIEKWRAVNITTLAQVRAAVSQKKITPTKLQKYGLRYYKDLNTRIPRDLITTIDQRILKRAVTHMSQDYALEVAGSYRRGHITSGDIDVIVTNKTGYNESFINDFIKVLSDLDHETPEFRFIDVLTKGKERASILIHCKRIVRIDILYMRFESYYPALVYFTGSYEFNEAMRGYAKAKGYRLNQNGLFKIHNNKLKLIPTYSEKEVFSKLGLKYVYPTDRNQPKIIPV